MNQIMKIVVVVFAVAGTLAMGAPVDARDVSPAGIRTRVEDVNVQLAQLQTHEHGDEAAQEIAQARLEITDVQNLLAQGETARSEVILRRLEARVHLIESMLERATFEQLAHQRETELFEIQAEASELQIDLETAQRQRRQLQDEVETIVESME